MDSWEDPRSDGDTGTPLVAHDSRSLCASLPHVPESPQPRGRLSPCVTTPPAPSLGAWGAQTAAPQGVHCWEILKSTQPGSIFGEWAASPPCGPSAKVEVLSQNFPRVWHCLGTLLAHLETGAEQIPPAQGRTWLLGSRLYFWGRGGSTARKAKRFVSSPLFKTTIAAQFVAAGQTWRQPCPLCWDSSTAFQQERSREERKGTESEGKEPGGIEPGGRNPFQPSSSPIPALFPHRADLKVSGRG